MKTSKPARLGPFQGESVCLVGAGAANLLWLRMFAMEPLADLQVTLVDPAPVSVYSAMLPGHLAGEYRSDECTVDLVRLCRRAGARFVLGSVTAIDRAARNVTVSDRSAPIAYDWLLLAPGVESGARPLSQLRERVAGVSSVLVGGAGPGGVELALALATQGKQVRLFESAERVLPKASPRASQIAQRKLEERGVQVHLGKATPSAKEGEALLAVAPAKAPTWIAASGFPVDAEGFVRVGADFFVQGSAREVAAGDCVARTAEVPRGGVFAVLGGGVAARNLWRAVVRDTKREQYAAPKAPMAIVNLGKGEGLLIRGKLALSGRLVRRWKEHLDRKWMQRWLSLVPVDPPPQTTPMLCAGCGGKASGRVLRDAGVADGKGDDAYRWTSGGGVDSLASVDWFRDPLFDPYLLGVVAANHALGDLYAKGAEPRHALAMVQLPEGTPTLQGRLLRELQAGARSVFDAEGVVLGGGHTALGSELAVGFAVYGETKAQFWPKRGGRPGDVVFLTKALGTGVLLAAHGQGALEGRVWASLVLALAAPQGSRAKALAHLPLVAATDVTGFGLLGHAAEMREEIDGSLELWPSAVPLLPGAAHLIDRGFVSSLHRENETFAQQLGVDPREFPKVFCDPQTVGGLLFVVPENEASRVPSWATPIGRVVERQSRSIVAQEK